MTQSKTTQSSRKVIAVASLVIGPLLMSVGDLFHPIESMDVTAQANIIIEHASRWYAAHLLLLIGMLIFIPGLLALVDADGRTKANGRVCLSNSSPRRRRSALRRLHMRDAYRELRCRWRRRSVSNQTPGSVSVGCSVRPIDSGSCRFLWGRCNYGDSSSFSWRTVSLASCRLSTWSALHTC